MPENQPVLLVTGASSGIGKATALLFARNGYRVALAARRFDRLEALAAQIESMGGDALPISADVTMQEDISNMVRATLDKFGQVDVLFNNAGYGRLDWLEQVPQDDVRGIIEVNLLGVIETTREVLPHMIARRKGHIINMSSVAGWIAAPTYSLYAASKFGVRGFTNALRREVRVFGIHVSGIYPGAVANEFSDKARIRRRTGIRTPAFMRLSNDDVARAILALERRPRRALIIPWPMRFAVWVNLVFPGLVDMVVDRGFVRRERSES